MSEDPTLDEFVNSNRENTAGSYTDTNILEQEQFGPFTLSTPGEWSAKRLGDIKRLITRGKQPTYDDDGIPVINQECIYWDGWHFENLRYLDEDVGEGWKEKYFPQRGDVILNSTGQGTLGRAQVYPDNKRRAIDSHVTLLRTDDGLNPYFHRYFLQSHLGQALLYSMCVNGSTGQIELSKTRLDLQPVPLPPLSEQRKIATVLHTVDQAIQKTEDIIYRLQRVLKGTRREVMSVGIRGHQISNSDSRFGEIPETWKIEKLSSVTDVTGGSTPSTDEAKYWGGNIPWATPTDLTGLDGIRIDTTESYITEEGLGSTSTNLLPPESVLMTSRATIGECAVNTVEMATNQGFQSLVPGDEINTWYLYYRIKEEANYLNSLGSGSTFSEVSNTTVQRVKIPIPPAEEQEEIANVLKSINKPIIKEKEYRNQLQQLKNGLMQDLLSGETRTADRDINIHPEVEKHG